MCAVSSSVSAAGSSSLIEVVVGIVDIIIIEEEGAVVEIIIIMELLGCWLDYGGKITGDGRCRDAPHGGALAASAAGRPAAVGSLYDDGMNCVLK